MFGVITRPAPGRGGQVYLNLFYAGSTILLLTLVTLLTSDGPVFIHLVPDSSPDEVMSEEETVEEWFSPLPIASFPPVRPLSRQELVLEAGKALTSCTPCALAPKQRTSWWESLGQEYEVPNILHLVRYGNKKMTFTEAVCLKSFLMQQKPDKFYLHSNLVDLSGMGKYWDRLYKDEGLNLREKLRVFMSKDPSELEILGRTSVSRDVAKNYWKFHVLRKYGGILLDTNVLLLQNIDHFRLLDFSTLIFPPSNFSLASCLMASHPSSPLLSRVMGLANQTTKDTQVTQDTFLARVEDMMQKEEVQVTNFVSSNENGTTDSTSGLRSTLLSGSTLKLTEALANSTSDPLGPLLLHIWNMNTYAERRMF